MGGHPFVYPPPPPATPHAAHEFAAYPQSDGVYDGYRRRGNEIDRGKRGQGIHGGRGGSRGGHFPISHPASGYNGHSFGSNNQFQPHAHGAKSQLLDQRPTGYPLPNYPIAQIPHYPADIRHNHSHESSSFPAPMDPSSPQRAYSLHDPEIVQYHDHQSKHQSHRYGSPLYNSRPTSQELWKTVSVQPPRVKSQAIQPIMMGPPIRIGLDGQPNVHQLQDISTPIAHGPNTYQDGQLSGNDPAYRHCSPLGIPTGLQGSPKPFSIHRARGQKRGHRGTFASSRNQNSRMQLSPAVPSYSGSLPLPVKPPPPQESSKKSRKKRRKHNQLGLTPKTEEHESSEEEDDDADEESRLGAVAGSSTLGLQQYNSQLVLTQNHSR